MRRRSFQINPLGGLHPRSLPGGSGLWAPWPRCCPWLVIVAGVALGPAFGFSPWLFLAVGAGCLLSGFMGRA